jgi:hypothetical protein
MVKTIAIVLGVVIVILLGVLIFWNPVKGPTMADAPGGMVFENPPTASSDGHVKISLPQANATIASPVAIEGMVTGGGWLFNGAFPIKVLNASGTVIGMGVAQALSDWKSMGMVPFSASISFTAPHSASGTITFSKADPSGAPWDMASFSVPIKFE